MTKLADVLAEVNRLILSLIVLGMNIGVWYLVLAGKITTSTELTMAIVTSAGTFTGLVLGFHFGSSAGSAAKDRERIANPPTPPQEKQP